MFTEITDNFGGVPAWALMWGLVWMVWAVFKVITWRQATRDVRRGNLRTAALKYFLGWPGMDPRPFIHRENTRSCGPALNKPAQWRRAIVTTLTGAIIIWIVTPRAMSISPFAAGWVGMIGTAMLFHFGILKLIALFWRARGVMVEPIMIEPTRATSLTDFWRRWNRGFRDFAHRLIFRPLHRRIGAIAATLATFFFSGLAHDLVISVPARAGYGLPTLYFLIQGIGVILEKSPPMRRCPAILLRAFMYIAVIAPMGLLFHPPFVRNVYLPFLDAIGALNTNGRLHMTLDLTPFIRLGGMLHFAILIAGAITPQVLNWRAELRKLHPMSRHIVWVHGLFIVMVIIGFGTLALINAPALATGASVLARTICGFIAIFWTTRLVLQFVLFDPGPLLSTKLLKFGYHGLTIVFLYFGITFGLAALRPMWL